MNTLRRFFQKIASHAADDFDTRYLMEVLARLSETDAMTNYEFCILSLLNRTYDYLGEPIKAVFSQLVDVGADGIRAEKEIAGPYQGFGIGRPIDWLKDIIGATGTDISSCISRHILSGRFVRRAPIQPQTQAPDE